MVLAPPRRLEGLHRPVLRSTKSRASTALASEPGPSAAGTTWSLWPSGPFGPPKPGRRPPRPPGPLPPGPSGPPGPFGPPNPGRRPPLLPGPPRPTESSASAAPSLRVGLDELGRLLPFGGIQHAVSIGIKLIDDFPVLIASHHARRRSAGAPKPPCGAGWAWVPSEISILATRRKGDLVLWADSRMHLSEFQPLPLTVFFHGWFHIS